MPDWESFVIPIPGKDLLEDVESGLEVILVFLEVVNAILEVVKIFLLDFGNPVKDLIEALLALILAIFEALKQQGLYAFFNLPEPHKDPNFTLVSGGYQAFIARFTGSLFNQKDQNRPQPVAGLDTSGFVLIVLDAQSVQALIALVKQILAFFGHKFPSPQYTAPANPRILPFGTPSTSAGSSTLSSSTGAPAGNPLLTVGQVFGSTLTGLLVEWTLPTTTNRSDNSFGGVIASTVNEFIPPNFLIEKTSIPQAQLLSVPVTVNFENSDGSQAQRNVNVRDENGDIWRTFEDYIVIDPTASVGNFISAQTGTFQYIDTDVTPDTTYFYRIRAFSGTFDPTQMPGAVTNTSPTYDPSKRQYIIPWPGPQGDPPVMGRPTGMLTGRLPTLIPNFDVVQNIEKTLRSAYALGFHLAPTPGDMFDSSGNPANSSTPVTDIGRGLLSDLAGPLGSVLPDPIPVDPTQANTPDPITGNYPLLPQFQRIVRFQAARIAQEIASCLLGQSALLTTYQAIQQGSLIHPVLGAGYLAGAHSPQDLVFGLCRAFQVDDFNDTSMTTYDPQVYITFSEAYTDANVRLNLVLVVTFLKYLTMQAKDPHWISVSILRDIVPWLGQYIYELIDKINSLLDAFNSLLQEIINFINMIERKITVLEEFIEYIISIIELIESLQVAVFLLSAQNLGGGIPDWLNAIQSAQGAPTSGVGSYTAGICLAYSAFDVGALATALEMIF